MSDGNYCRFCGAPDLLDRIAELEELLREAHSVIGLNFTNSDKILLQARIRKALRSKGDE